MKFGYIGSYSLHVFIICCPLQIVLSSSQITARSCLWQHKEVSFIVKIDPFSWKNEWSEANNLLYSFFLNYL